MIVLEIKGSFSNWFQGIKCNLYHRFLSLHWEVEAIGLAVADPCSPTQHAWWHHHYRRWGVGFGLVLVLMLGVERRIPRRGFGEYGWHGLGSESRQWCWCHALTAVPPFCCDVTVATALGCNVASCCCCSLLLLSPPCGASGSHTPPSLWGARQQC